MDAFECIDGHRLVALGLLDGSLHGMDVADHLDSALIEPEIRRLIIVELGPEDPSCPYRQTLDM